MSSAPNQMVVHDATQIASTVDRLRATFDSGVTLSRSWRVAQLQQLKKLLTEGKEAMSEALYADLHRSRFESHLIELNIVEHEVQEALDHLDDWMAPEAKPTNLLNQPASSAVKRDPLGVALIMAPWNYPVQLLLGPLVGAIAAGNCALLRPAEYSSNVSETLGALVAKYMDPTAFAVTIGGRATTTNALACRFDKIFFTGGPTLGKIVLQAAAAHLTPVTLELGGKSPAYVDKSADVDIAARRLTWGAFINAGQTCVRPDHVLVHADVADELVARIGNYVREFYASRANDSTEFGYADAAKGPASIKTSPYFGRIINGGGAITRLAKIVETDKQYLVLGGDVDVEQRFVAPTVLDFGADSAAFHASAAMQAELFGPILPILRVANAAEAVASIKRREKPLAMYIFTTTAAVRTLFETTTSSGGLVFNDAVVHLANSNLPFGGVGHSGMGCYHGKYSFDEFSHLKAVMYKQNILDMPARYPPYTGFKRSLIYVRRHYTHNTNHFLCVFALRAPINVLM